jgi:hypothetical protein
MSTTNLEERVADLEAQYAELLRLVKNKPGKDDWRSVIGIFADDPDIEELHAEGRRIREEDRAAAKRLGDS